MSNLTGVFRKFKDLDQIPPFVINPKVKNKRQLEALENLIGNRILYPQTVSVSVEDMEIDFAVLRESIKRDPGLFFNNINKKIILTSDFISRFPPSSKLITTIVQVLVLPEVTTVYMKKNIGIVLAGSIINIRKLPVFKKLQKDQTLIDLMTGNISTKARLGEIVILPLKERHINIKIGSSEEILAVGGELGLVLDLRLEEVPV